MMARVPTLPTPDDLLRHVDDLESLKELTAVVLQGGPKGAELTVDDFL
jgi:hypothetical protein